MVLNEFQRVSYKLLGPTVQRSINLTKIEVDLRKARLSVRAEAYMATALAMTILSALFGVIISAFVFFVLVPVLLPGAPSILVAFFPVVPLLMAAGTYAGMLGSPASRAKSRAKNIDQRIPYALNYIAAMASAGVNIDQVFRSLGQQEKIYGECAKEAQAIYRDMAYFGRDSVTAMKRAIERSPSDKWREFLQGAITTVTSGGDLTAYFREQSRRLQFEHRQEQAIFTETIGILAEAYVTAAVAGPLFLIVMIAIFVLLGSAPMLVLQAVVYFLLPVANLGFIFGLRAITPEA
jgi:flagellar protein FlaJ